MVDTCSGGDDRGDVRSIVVGRLRRASRARRHGRDPRLGVDAARPASAWAPELQAAVRMCLSTRFPVLIVAGPELIKIYNDGYREMLGTEKHPRALGAPAREIWAEVWDVIGPLLDHVRTTGEPTWSEDFPLRIERNHYRRGVLLHLLVQPAARPPGRGGRGDRHRDRDHRVGDHPTTACGVWPS